MAEVQCVDGSVLSLVPVPRLDRRGVAYEVTLRLLLDGAPFGDIGECSGWRLARAAEQVRRAQVAGGPEAFPPTGVDTLLDTSGRDGRGDDGPAAGGRAADVAAWDGRVPGAGDGAASGGRPSAELRRLLPRDAELLCLRSRDPDDGDGDGELHVWLRHDRSWQAGRNGARGRWSTRSRAVVDCWGDGGRGVRCVLDSAGLLRLLDGLVADAAAVAGRPAPV